MRLDRQWLQPGDLHFAVELVSLDIGGGPGVEPLPI
jgi:hypothetical protein